WPTARAKRGPRARRSPTRQADMSEVVPIMRIGDTLLISLQGDLDDTTVLRIEDQLTREVARTQATGTLIDVSGLTMVDSFIARVITRIVGMIRLLGSQAAVVGIQPAVAITLVELGVPMGHLDTALNAEQGMALLRRLRDYGDRAD
ncbi:STAS domain-containing protein, partial [Actinomadura sp. HBU206391]|uniref:STAS domain-containing protein n=1 Tax=Actinomadura sp. HBU206391 TaxID=2731692 RepID=UPI001C9BD2F7